MSLAVSRDNSIDIKTVFRYELSTLPASLLNEKDGLLLLSCEKDLTDSIEIDEVAKSWMDLKQRRLHIQPQFKV